MGIWGCRTARNLDGRILMADNGSTRTPRYPFTRGNTPAEPAGRSGPIDPLSELARLIGQTDPFADPIPAAARRDLRDILSGRRNDDWNASPAPAQSEYEEPAPLAPDHHDFPSALSVNELPHIERLNGHSQPYDPPTEYGQAEPDAPLYGDDGRLLPDDAYQNDQYSPGHYQPEAYPAEEPPAQSRKGLFAVIAVFGLAVVGTAGAYGYRTMSAGGVPGLPPLIRADSSPNKVAATQAGDTGASKQIYDRLGADRSQNEKVVSREEQPVNVRAAQPRPAFPPATNQSGPASGSPSGAIGQTNNAWPAPSGAAPAQTPGGAASANEPRKIRTIPIRSDQLASAQPAETPAASPAAATPPAVRQQTARPQSAPAAANGPLSLNPQGTAERPSRTAAAAPSPRATESAAAAGAYVVQIAAHKTQEEASASFRSAQAKYPDVLSGRKLLIRKKEVDGKGTFYGAQVGPFASRTDATQLCENLKSAGGSCIVQRN
jgi:hypothetical protein